MSGARHRQNDEERKLVEEARLLRDWLARHRAERKVALPGPYGSMSERLLCILKILTLKSALLLLAYVRGIDWWTIGSPTRLIVLREVNRGVTALRLKHGRRLTTAGLAGARASSSPSCCFYFPHTRRRPGRSPV